MTAMAIVAACIDPTVATDKYSDKVSNQMKDQMAGFSPMDKWERTETLERRGFGNTMDKMRNLAAAYPVDNIHLRYLSESNTPTATPTIVYPREDKSQIMKQQSLITTAMISVVPATTVIPTLIGTIKPNQLSRNPTSTPSNRPSGIPTHVPSTLPHNSPSHVPSIQPNSTPSTAPTDIPSGIPTHVPSTLPHNSPSHAPSIQPTSIPSTAPTVTPTNIPSNAPTHVPSTLPHNSPSYVPSIQPTSGPSTTPTITPSTAPTGTPTDIPSDIPTHVPSAAPTPLPSTAPSNVPTAGPTQVPSTSPTTSPTALPSASPSETPSASPSALPSVLPSQTPTALPSSLPTGAPSSKPSDKPSNYPSSTPSTSVVPSSAPSSDPSSTPSSKPTSGPSAKPTATPSLAPSLNPSSSPTLSLQEFAFEAKVSFEDCNILEDSLKEIFERVTKDVITNQLDSYYTTTLEFVEVRITVKDMIPSVFGEFNLTEAVRGPATRLLQKIGLISSSFGKSSNPGLRRRLQTARDDLLVIFNLEVSVRCTITISDQHMQDNISQTFDTHGKRIDYISKLQATAGDNTSLSSINSVAVSIDGTRIVQSSPAFTDPDKGLTLYLPIAAGAMGFLLICAFFWRRRVLPSGNSEDTPMSFLKDDAFNESERHDLRIESTIEVQQEEMTMSTLGNPIPANPVFGAFGVIPSDSTSASTNPGYDFNRAYGGAVEEHSVSIADGRKSAESPDFLHNNNRTFSDSEVSSSSLSSVNQENVSLFTDDQSFERMYGGDEENADEQITVHAPAGKLGVVIDKQPSNIPVVHAIKDTSVLVNQVHIGDKLLSVDEEDTTEMSALGVSKLISSKSHSPRILIFARD